MIKFKDYITENYKDGGLSVFDIDDTLFHTTAKIAVLKNGKQVKELTNQEFNTYKLQDGESFDFSQFRDAKKFNAESKPIGRMLETAKAIIRRIEDKPNSKVVIVTARANFDNKEVFLDTFRKHGFDMNKIRVERAGNIEDVTEIATKKAIIIYNYLNTKQFNRVRLFDDSMANLAAFLKLKAHFSDVTFEAFFVKPDGTVKKVR